MYDIHYIVSRENDDPIQTRTTAASRLDSVIASAKSQFHGAKTTYPNVIGFYIRDKVSGEVAFRWYADDK